MDLGSARQIKDAIQRQVINFLIAGNSQRSLWVMVGGSGVGGGGGGGEGRMSRGVGVRGGGDNFVRLDRKRTRVTFSPLTLPAWSVACDRVHVALVVTYTIRRFSEGSPSPPPTLMALCTCMHSFTYCVFKYVYSSILFTFFAEQQPD